MNPYLMLGSRIGTAEAASLSERLAAWHDAMVGHERRLKNPRSTDTCNDECPHAEANALWAEALETFGNGALDLTFLQARASKIAVRESASSTGLHVGSRDMAMEMRG